MSNFFRSLFREIKWWVITAIVGYLVFNFLPSLFSTINDKPWAQALISSIITFILYFFIILYKSSQPDENEEKLDNSLLKCYKKFVVADRNDISQALHNLKSSQGIDLAWEIKSLGLKTCLMKNCEHWKADGLVESLSVRRRNRMIEIGLSYLNWRVNTCLAVETHFLDIISNEEKYNDDIVYRDKQIKKIRARWKIIEKAFFNLDYRRIIIIAENDWTKLKNDYNDRLIEYFQWHVDNKWKAMLYIGDRSESARRNYTLSNFASIEKPECNDFSDFVIIKKWCQKDTIVFAQNSEEIARLITNDNVKEVYLDWFENVWNKGIRNINKKNNNKKKYHLIDDKFLIYLKQNSNN